MENDPIQRQAGAGRNDPVVAAPPQQAGPIQPNLPVGVGAQNGPAGVANNALGLMNRFLFGGPPVQGQDQPAARPLGQLPNLVNAAAQPGGVLIQYNIHYQVLDGQQQQPESQVQPQDLQPAPQFRGFQGPDEAWHPWPRDVPASNQPDQETGASTEQPTTSDLGVGPREAAARAAARRMKDSNSLSTSTASANPHKSNLAPNLIPLSEYDFQSPSSGSQDQRLDPTSGGADLRVPISSLPPLTDEQLALMDQTTREAIDERLKVLEGVSTVVYRCIDDLMRVRSALPPVSTFDAEPAKDAERGPLDPTATESSME